MIDRFRAWKHTPAGTQPPEWARPGVPFSLATTLDKPSVEWVEGRPGGASDATRACEDDVRTLSGTHLPAARLPRLVARRRSVVDIPPRADAGATASVAPLSGVTDAG